MPSADRLPTVTDLIEHGRDREAAERGAKSTRIPDRAGHQGGPMDVLAQLDLLAPLLVDVVDGIGPEHLDDPTPCEDFTVRGVLEHMIGGATMFAAAFRGVAPADPDLAEPLASFVPALGELGAAIGSPGALDRMVAAPFGDVPGEHFARFVVLDGLVHGWDMACATGQPYEPSPALVAAADDFARGAIDPLRDGSTFATATEAPVGATPIERLAAYTGRRV